MVLAPVRTSYRLFFLLAFLTLLMVVPAFLVSFSLTVSSASEFWLESGSLLLSETHSLELENDFLSFLSGELEF